MAERYCATCPALSLRRPCSTCQTLERLKPTIWPHSSSVNRKAFRAVTGDLIWAAAIRLLRNTLLDVAQQCFFRVVRAFSVISQLLCESFQPNSSAKNTSASVKQITPNVRRCRYPAGGGGQCGHEFDKVSFVLVHLLASSAACCFASILRR